jgi:hypothetical protein
MRLKIKTIFYLLLGGIYSLTPAILIGMSNGRVMPSYTVTPQLVMVAFTFSFVPFVVGFLGGEMFIDDMDESDPLYNPDTMRKNKKD